jgi:hypothetical protein
MIQILVHQLMRFQNEILSISVVIALYSFIHSFIRFMQLTGLSQYSNKVLV